MYSGMKDAAIEMQRAKDNYYEQLRTVTSNELTQMRQTMFL